MAAPSSEQRQQFIGDSLERAWSFLRHEGVRDILGATTVAVLERRLSQVVIPDMAVSTSGLEIDLPSHGESQQVFPVVAMLPGENLYYPKEMTTQADKVVEAQIRRMRELCPNLSHQDALDALIRREAYRRQDTTTKIEMGRGYSAQVFTERGEHSVGGTRFAIYQQPIVAFAMQDAKNVTYPFAHPVVTTHEVTHLDDYSMFPVVDMNVTLPHEYRLSSELRAYHISALAETAIDRYGLDSNGLWHRAVYPGRPTVSSRVEALRRLHTTAERPYRPLPSLYLALEVEGLESIYQANISPTEY